MLGLKMSRGVPVMSCGRWLRGGSAVLFGHKKDMSRVAKDLDVGEGANLKLAGSLICLSFLPPWTPAVGASLTRPFQATQEGAARGDVLKFSDSPLLASLYLTI